MGVVYLAHNKLMDRDEVLKVIGRHFIDHPGVLERFLREIRTVAKLRHPNIVTAYSAFRSDEGLTFDSFNEPHDRYARLILARELASDAAGYHTPLEACSRLARWFDVDHIRMEAEMLIRKAHFAGSDAGHEALAEASLATGFEAVGLVRHGRHTGKVVVTGTIGQDRGQIESTRTPTSA